MGYRRALDIVTRTPDAIEMSVFTDGESINDLAVSKNESPEHRLFVDEMLDAICGTDLEVDRFILDSRLKKMTFDEVASELEMNPSTVRARFSKMQKRAHEMFGSDYFSA